MKHASIAMKSLSLCLCALSLAHIEASGTRRYCQGYCSWSHDETYHSALQYSCEGSTKCGSLVLTWMVTPA